MYFGFPFCQNGKPSPSITVISFLFFLVLVEISDEHFLNQVKKRIFDKRKGLYYLDPINPN